MVFVNTVVLVKGTLGGTDGNVALALACFGGGSMVAALVLPRLLDRLPDRRIMLSSAGMLAAALVVFGAVMTVSRFAGSVWYVLLSTWALLGIGYSAVMTPSGRLLRRSAGAADRPAVFAAQFALSHVCWLLTYPLAGWLGSTAGLAATLFALAIISLAGTGLAASGGPARLRNTEPESQRPDPSSRPPPLHKALLK